MIPPLKVVHFSEERTSVTVVLMHWRELILKQLFMMSGASEVGRNLVPYTEKMYNSDYLNEIWLRTWRCKRSELFTIYSEGHSILRDVPIWIYESGMAPKD